jgi:WD40 repeat protein
MYTVSATSPTSLLVVELGSPTGADDGNNALRTRVVQVLQQHRKSITAICVTRDGTLVTVQFNSFACYSLISFYIHICFVVQGSADCTVRVWDHENTIPASSILSLGLSVVRPNSSDSEKPLKEHARHVLRGHRSTVNLLCAHSELDVCVSSSLTENSDDGLLLMHSLRSGQVLSRLQLPWLSVRGTFRRAVPTLLTVSSQGRILVYCKVKHFLVQPFPSLLKIYI